MEQLSNENEAFLSGKWIPGGATVSMDKIWEGGEVIGFHRTICRTDGKIFGEQWQDKIENLDSQVEYIRDESGKIVTEKWWEKDKGFSERIIPEKISGD